MVMVRTTLDPRTEVEMDEHDAAVLEHQGLLYQGSDADLKGLLDRDPHNALSEPTAMPVVSQPGTAKPSASATAAPADAKTGA